MVHYSCIALGIIYDLVRETTMKTLDKVTKVEVDFRGEVKWLNKHINLSDLSLEYNRVNLDKILAGELKPKRESFFDKLAFWRK